MEFQEEKMQYTHNLAQVAFKFLESSYSVLFTFINNRI